MPREKIDANVVGFAITEESSAKQLPANPIWRTREPNSFDDLGGDYTLVARRPFSPSRQRKKGSTTDLDVDGGFNEDLTQNNMQWPLQGFFFADLRAKPKMADYLASFAAPTAFVAAAGTDNLTVVAHGLSTGDGPFSVATDDALPTGLVAATPYWVVVTAANTFRMASSYQNAIDGVYIDLTTNGSGANTITRYAAVDGATDAFVVNNVAGFLDGSLLLARNFLNAGNNGLHLVDDVTGPVVSVTGDLVAEATAPSTATLQVVGFQFPEDDASLDMRVGEFALVSAAIDMTDFGLIPGEWAFLGGDAAATRFDAGYGYARVKSVAEDGGEIVFDKSTFTPVDEAGADKTIRIFFGDVLKNEDDPDLIVQRTWQQERTLGRDDDGRQAQYITGAVSNELVWNSPLADIVKLDLGFIGMGEEFRTGAEGPKSSDGGATLLPALGEDAFNTSKNVFQIRMNIIDPATLNPTPLFARVTEWSATINNNVSAAKAQGVLGAFDMTVGNFDVDMECSAYFTTVAAVQAIRDNADVTFHAIYSKSNAAVILDMPLIGLGGGRLEVEQDQAIMVPLENAAAESPFGHTLLLNWLPYVPNVGVA